MKVTSLNERHRAGLEVAVLRGTDARSIQGLHILQALNLSRITIGMGASDPRRQQSRSQDWDGKF